MDASTSWILILVDSSSEYDSLNWSIPTCLPWLLSWENSSRNGEQGKKIQGFSTGFNFPDACLLYLWKGCLTVLDLGFDPCGSLPAHNMILWIEDFLRFSWVSVLLNSAPKKSHPEESYAEPPAPRKNFVLCVFISTLTCNTCKIPLKMSNSISSSC